MAGLVNGDTPECCWIPVLDVDERSAEIAEFERAVLVASEANCVIRYPLDVGAGRSQCEETDFTEVFALELSREPDAEHAFEFFYLRKTDSEDAVEPTGPKDGRIATGEIVGGSQEEEPFTARYTVEL